MREVCARDRLENNVGAAGHTEGQGEQQEW